MTTRSIRFEAESLFHLRPRRELDKWLAGDTMRCPICNQFVIDGEDCTNDDYDRIQLILRSLMKQADKEEEI